MLPKDRIEHVRFIDPLNDHRPLTGSAIDKRTVPVGL
jgi:hypothetical protein